MREYNDPPTIEVLQPLVTAPLFSGLDSFRDGIKDRMKGKITGKIEANAKAKAEKAQEKAEKAKAEAEKAEAEAKVEAEKVARAAEKAAAKAQEKAEKAAAKAQEKAEKAAAKAQEKAEKVGCDAPRLENLSKAVRLWYTLGIFANDFDKVEFTARNWGEKIYKDFDTNLDKSPNKADDYISNRTIKDILYPLEIDQETEWPKFKKSLIDSYWGRDISNNTNEEKYSLALKLLIEKSNYLSKLEPATKTKYLSALELVIKSEYLLALEIAQELDIPHQELINELGKLANSKINKEKSPYLDALELVVRLEYLLALELVKPFDVTGRTIVADLRKLTELPRTSEHKFLNVLDRTTFQLPDTFPSLLTTEKHSNIAKSADTPYLMDDFSSFARMFSEPLKEVQRFHLHGDYHTLDQSQAEKIGEYPRQSQAEKIGEYQKQLREIWQNGSGIPCKLTYNSSSEDPFTAIVYPVCLYYYQRCFYLCAFQYKENVNQISWNKYAFECTEYANQISWNNYRLDRIQELRSLDWQEDSIPIPLMKLCQEINDSDLVDKIEDGITQAYGFDFYQPAKQMLLRFNHKFHDRYIKNTWRHNTFKLVEPNKINGLLNKLELNTSDRSLIEKRIKTHRDDAYYTMNYRTRDNSVIMRLRAWCPNVEVLYPPDLRQRMRDDMQQTWKLYSEDK